MEALTTTCARNESHFGGADLHRARRRGQAPFDSDQDLIERVVCGDPHAAEAFVGRYGRLIQAILRRMELPIEDRQDLYQQVFQHLWERNYQRLSQWRARGKGKFSSFLEVVVVHLVYDQKRRDPEGLYRIDCLDFGDEPHEFEEGRYRVATTPDPVRVVICRQQKAAIDSMLCCLSERDAQIIWRRHYRDQSYREIAEALNIRLNQVGVVLLRAEQRLLKYLKGAYPGLCD